MLYVIGGTYENSANSRHNIQTLFHSCPVSSSHEPAHLAKGSTE